MAYNQESCTVWKNISLGWWPQRNWGWGFHPLYRKGMTEKMHNVTMCFLNIIRIRLVPTWLNATCSPLSSCCSISQPQGASNHPRWVEKHVNYHKDVMSAVVIRGAVSSLKQLPMQQEVSDGRNVNPTSACKGPNDARYSNQVWEGWGSGGLGQQPPAKYKGKTGSYQRRFSLAIA